MFSRKNSKQEWVIGGTEILCFFFVIPLQNLYSDTLNPYLKGKKQYESSTTQTQFQGLGSRHLLYWLVSKHFHQSRSPPSCLTEHAALLKMAKSFDHNVCLVCRTGTIKDFVKNSSSHDKVLKSIEEWASYGELSILICGQSWNQFQSRSKESIVAPKVLLRYCSHWQTEESKTGKKNYIFNFFLYTILKKTLMFKISIYKLLFKWNYKCFV